MKHSLQLKLSQHLTLTPQLQQSIRLLQLSTVELNQELERYLAENPLLEREDAVAEGSPGAREEPAAAREPEESASETEGANGHDVADEMPALGDDGPGAGGRRDDDRDDFTQYAAAEPTLQEHLLQQLALTPLCDRDKRIAALLVAHLDEDGYFATDDEELSALANEAVPDLEPEELDIALKHVQNLEPTGIGARDAAECLALQLRALPAGTAHRDGALELVTKHLDALAARDFTRLKRLL